MRILKTLAAVIFAAALPCVALAQTSPNLTQGQVLTPGQWNNLFASKQDVLGFTPMNVNGGVFLGRLVTAPPGASTSGLNLTPGTAPGSPANGDLWVTSSSIFAQINGSTVDLINGVCPTCAALNAANIFSASPQTVQGLTTTQPGWYAQITGDTSARVRVGLNSTDVPSLALGPGNAVRDTFLERTAAATFRLGSPDAASPIAQTLGVQNVVAGTTNTVGAALTINGSRGTGTGAGGNIVFQVAPPGGAGSTQNALSPALTVSGATGALTTGSGGLTVNGAFTATGLVTNADLANSSLTVNGVAITLGGSQTVTAAAGTLTGSTLASGVTGSSLTSLGTIASLAAAAIGSVTPGTGVFTTLAGNTSVSSPIHAAPGALTFESNGTTAAGHIDTSQHWVLGTNVNAASSNPAAVTITSNASNTAAIPFTGTALQLVGLDNLRNYFTMNAYGVSGGVGVPNGFGTYAARGTQASPTATQSGDTIFNLLGNGYGATGFGSLDGIFSLNAAENFTDTAQGTNWQFNTNTIGTVSPVRRLMIQAGIVIGNPTGGDQGAGTVNASAYYANGIPVAGTGTVTEQKNTFGYGLTQSGNCDNTSTNASSPCNAAVSLTTASNVLASNVAMSTGSTYFDGPSMAQGTSGVWSVYGAVTISDTATSNVNCKLWDGTTIIASAYIRATSGPIPVTTNFSGNISSPAANVKISCENTVDTTSAIVFNFSGNSHDSYVYGHRIQ